jgi:phosphopantetheine--protein transferase-like protein
MNAHVLIGVDLVEVGRFVRWQQWRMARLERIFSHEELVYCFAHASKTPERLAVRYAAREANYKALAPLSLHTPVPFLTVCRALTTQVTGHGMELSIAWDTLRTWYDHARVQSISVSATHTATSAMAIVLISTHIA